MELLLIDPKTRQDRYWPVESRDDLSGLFERTPEAAEWCRRDEENREAFLDVVRELEGEKRELADGLQQMFLASTDIGEGAFAEAMQRVLADGGGLGRAIADEWVAQQKEARRRREEEKEKKQREEKERLSRIPGRVTTLTLPGGAEMEMVWCPAGEFWMGSPDWEEGRNSDEIRHQVRLTRGFWMAKFPVTGRQWTSVMGSDASHYPENNKAAARMSWEECVSFCETVGMGMRLPTEAEWEYACRAGSETAYFWGNSLDGYYHAWCHGGLPCGTRSQGYICRELPEVGKRPPNPWGLFDMHGTVLEWCADWYGAYKGGIEIDPMGPVSGTIRVQRGGSWNRAAESCRSACRSCGAGRGLGKYDHNDHGFRPVCNEIP